MDAGRLAPGTGIIAGERRSSHARAICCGLTPRSAAMRWKAVPAEVGPDGPSRELRAMPPSGLRAGRPGPAPCSAAVRARCRARREGTGFGRRRARCRGSRAPRGSGRCSRCGSPTARARSSAPPASRSNAIGTAEHVSRLRGPSNRQPEQADHWARHVESRMRCGDPHSSGHHTADRTGHAQPCRNRISCDTGGIGHFGQREVS